MATRTRWPDVAIPPGETLAEELQARGLSQSELARRMNRPVQAISEIVRGMKLITPQTALQLEQVLGIPGDFWLRLEANYRYNRARLEQGRASRPRRAQAKTSATRVVRTARARAAVGGAAIGRRMVGARAAATRKK